jgi:hypothetical protein
MIRRLKLLLSTALWHLTRPLRKPPRELTELQQKIDAARRAHRRTAHLESQKREAVNRMMRQGAKI